MPKNLTGYRATTIHWNHSQPGDTTIYDNDMYSDVTWEKIALLLLQKSQRSVGAISTVMVADLTEFGLNDDDIAKVFRELQDLGVLNYLGPSLATSDDVRFVMYTIINREKLLELHKKYIQQMERARGDRRDTMIQRRPDGKFYMEGVEIEMTPGSFHYVLFDILYTHAARHGVMPYQEIDRLFREQTGQPMAKDLAATRKRIQKALSKQQGLFRYAKVAGRPLDNIIGDTPIIRNRRKGVEFNNPLIR